MSALTRIFNNQIYNATIVGYQKIAPGTLTGSLFASNVTVPGDLLISGNLFVLGTSAYTTIASTNTYVNDPLVTLNNGFSGTNNRDIGLVLNRGTDQNQAIVWAEPYKEFRLIGTTETGTTYGNVVVSNFANLHVGNIGVDYNMSVGTLSVNTAITASSLNLSGNLLASTVLASFLTASTVAVGNIAAVTVGNVGTQFNGAAINLSGNVLASTVLAQLVTSDDATFGNVDAGFIGNVGTQFTGASLNLSGNVLASTIESSFLTASTVAVGNISAVTIGNTGAAIQGLTADFAGDVSGGLAEFTAINNTPIGNATASTGSFTTLISSGVTEVTNSSTATGLGTGAFRVGGGASISGNLWVGGNLNVIGNSYVITSNAGIFYGDLAGFGALYAGVAGYTPLPVTVFQSAADYNGYVQNNFENLSIGNQASTDWVATAGDGDDLNNYINMGITSPNWDGTQDNSLTNAVAADDGYLYIQGNITTGAGGNLTIGASTPGSREVKIIAGGNTATSITAVFRNPGTAALSPTTGAFTVKGGIGITGNMYVGAGIQNTVIGNVTPAEGYFTNLSLTGFINTSGNISGAQVNAGQINTTGNVLATAGVFNELTVNGYINNTANISTVQLNAGQINTTGNVLATAGVFNELTVNGNESVTGYLNVTGNLLADAGTVRILNVNNTLWANSSTATTTQGTGALVIPTGGISVAGAANIAGAITTAGAAQFNNTVTIGGISTFTNTSNANEATGTSGALQIKGGTSIAKDLWVGGNIYASNIFGVTHQVITVQDPLVYFDAANTYPYNYDIGFYSNFVGPNPIDNTGNVYQHTGVVRDNADNTWKFFSNVRTEPGVTAISFDSDTIYDPVRAGNLTLTYTQAATSTTTGALQVAGGAGIVGAVVAGQINSTGNVLGQAGTFNALTVNGNESVTGYLNVTGNVMTAQLDAGQINTTGNVLATAGVFNALTVNGNETVTGYLNVTGNVLASTVGASFITASTAAVGNISAVTIGNVGATVIGTTAEFNGNVIGGLAQFAAINATPIGNASASTGAFTTLSASAGVWANSTTESTSTSTGAIVVAGGIGLAGNIFQGGAYHDTSSSDALIFNTPTTVDAFKSATDLEVGATSGTMTINNPTVVGTQSTQSLYNTTATTLNFAGAATTLVAGATSGVAHLRNANIWVPNATSLDGSQTDVSVFTQAATNANVLIKANVILGANVGQTTIQNPTLVGTQTTQNVYNTIATTVNAFGAATALTLGANNSGNLIVRNDSLFIQNNANVNGTRDATTTTSAALTVAGGAAVNLGMIVGGTLYANGSAKTTTTTTGAIVVPTGGLSVTQGNIHAGERLFVGPLSTNAGATFSALTIAAVNADEFFVQLAQQNLDNRGSTDLALYSSNATETNGWADVGFTGNAFADPTYTITKPNDGYFIVRPEANQGGNLILATSEAGVYNDIVIGVGSFEDTAEVARFHGNISTAGNAWIKYTTVSTTPNTGALRVDGGVGLAGNLRAGGGAVINNGQTADPFQVKGVATTSLIYADTAQGAVIVGGSNTAPQLGSTLKINGSDSLLLPIGSTGQRPGATGNIDIAGMIRFNTTIQNMEFYDGTQWQTAGSVFTIISDRQFTGNTAGGFGNVDGTNTDFTIQANSTTSSTIVSINGVIQFPTLAYSVSGTTLTFTEPPAPDDVIDVRVLATTSTIGALANGNGLQQFIASDTAAEIWTGVTSTTKQFQINKVGDVEYLTGGKTTYTQTATNIAANNTPYVISTWSQTDFVTVKYVISAKKDATNFQSMEALVTTDQAGNAYITTYAVVSNGVDMGGLTANVVGGNVQVYWTTTTNIVNANVKAMGTYIV